MNNTAVVQQATLLLFSRQLTIHLCFPVFLLPISRSLPQMSTTTTVFRSPETGAVVVSGESSPHQDITQFDVYGWTEHKQPDCLIGDDSTSGIVNFHTTMEFRHVFYYVEKGISKEEAEEALSLAEGKAVRLGRPINLLAAYAKYQRGVGEHNES